VAAIATYSRRAFGVRYRAHRRSVLAPVAIWASIQCCGKPGLLKEKVIGRGGAPHGAVRAVAGGYDVMITILGMLKKRMYATLHGVHTRLLRWTKPVTGTPVRGAVADVTMSKAALVAENALLRQ